ncbi:methylated-DNA--[protein]-cysteine S-methyltransferase [Conexibacter sp. JD483]|uniref:methylated-DNA--[protein]-cysteine S-methyltransferase n=1 Tax=unclassified Conexibacter TaxID=2627773 RepID=UPI002717F449|nr:MULTISPECIES: methylated-DNA--[protein]-cysteine S-methyltransferase [unclassified Conexibacter]MDO8187140.1 methylated-DNA--[protein]-cysteine S-methyltransferase [Conexibacter sp. CPCC 205706]MDO8200316.1 methylated-DNA--[protein]-cysteine S-methyltransferase [Conexibacter sp. CPCC 205762]MDR9368888.1 methylated-DNA--[protein]-cysteine S-methyltransferase [Conexibacter sp. JD483]
MDEQLGYATFETAIGWVGIAWGEHGLTGVWLPERSEAATRAQIVRAFPRALPLPVLDGSVPARARDGIVALLAGADDDLADVVLDVRELDDFPRAVYALARGIRPGRTTTYGAIARELEAEPGAARAVGQALGRNPWPIVVPCHRVVAASGGTGGFSAPGGVDTKLRMLELERVHGDGTARLF